MTCAAPIVIVGTGLAGVRCATTLRRLAPHRRVVLLGDEPHDPYERPPLSKELLARTRDAGDLTLPGATLHDLGELGVDVRIEHVASIEQGTVELIDGSRLDAEAIVLATGARPRALASKAPPERLHVLRSLDDAVRLRGVLEPGRRLAIIGSGFIGSEAASTALGRGVEVTLLEAEQLPFARSLGDDVGAWLADRWIAAGVDLRLDCRVDSIEQGPTSPVRISLLDGSSIDADEVLVAIGTEPRDELFHAAFPYVDGAVRGRGVPCDATGRTAIEGIWAVGDVALVSDPSNRPSRRTEHWTDTSSAAIRVAHDIAGCPAPRTGSPYAWSDQFGVRLQVVGHPSGQHERLVDDRSRDTLLARYLDAQGSLCGVVAVGHPEHVARYRRDLAPAA